jgi:hypothetical protein
MENTGVVTSKQFTLNWRDIGIGLFLAVGGPVLAILQDWIGIWAGGAEWGEVADWRMLIKVSISTAILYLGKNFFSKPKVIITNAEADVINTTNSK